MNRPKGYWNRETCLAEAKNYSSRSEFKQGCHLAYRTAVKNGWIGEYDWFTILWEEKWNRETCYKEAKKYEKYEDFREKSASAYATACKNGWIGDYDWLERKRIRQGTWSSYEKCYIEAQKYTRRCDFEKL